MKIIALIPFRNEEKFLPLCLASLKGVADEIIGMDDSSTDNSLKILHSFGGVALHRYDKASAFSQGKEENVRQILLDEARRRGMTHGICLDGDEALSPPFRQHGRELLSQLPPGGKLSLQLISLWGSPFEYRDGDYSRHHRTFRNCMFCDAPEDRQASGFLHAARTPGLQTVSLRTKISPEQGVLLHFSAVNLPVFYIKQAWYFCIELVHAPMEAERINAYYSREMDTTHLKLKKTPSSWTAGLDLESVTKNPMRPEESWHWRELKNMFDTYGIEFFESLEIWHIPALRAEFLQRTGRIPRAPSARNQLCRCIEREKIRLERFSTQLFRTLRGRP